MLNKCLRSTWMLRPRAATRALPLMATVQPQQNVMPFQQQQSYQQQEQTNSKFNFAHFILLGTALTSYLYLHNSEMAFALKPTDMENSKGNKQNKVRFFGTPQQIFRQFSTLKDEDGNDAMSYKDFFHALTPYNYNKPKSKDSYFKKHAERVDELMRIADVDKDGQISFAEFYFFVLICQTPSRVIA